MGKSKWNYENVLKFISENSNCELLENDYLGYNVKMKFRCGCGEVFYTTWKKFVTKTEKPKRQCQSCTNKQLSMKFRENISDIKKFIKQNSNCTLLS